MPWLPPSPLGTHMTLSLGLLPKDQSLPGVPQSHPVPHLAHEVRQVEHGHDEDGQPLAQHAVTDLGLQAREQAQCNEVGDRNGQHVGPDDPCHNISVQQQGWGNRGVLEGDAVSSMWRDSHTCHWAPRCLTLTPEGGPAPFDSWMRHIKTHVGPTAAVGHLMGWAVLRGPAAGQGWGMVLLGGKE